MADGSVEIDVKLNDSKAKSQASRTGKDISKSIESGMKGATSAAKNTESQIKSAMSGAASSSKSSFTDVGSSAKSNFGNVGDAAKTASSDASSSFKNISADASGSFSDVGSKAKDGFSEVGDAASTASSDATSSFQGIADDSKGSFSQVGDEAKEGFEEVSDAAEQVSDDVDDTFAGVFPAAAGVAAAAVVALTAAIGAIATESVQVGMDFDKSMSQVAATMGKTTDEIDELTEFAKEMGATTAFSASQASEALNYMALAGYDAQTSMDMLPTVLSLAAAGNMELATASDMVTDAQSALGLTLEETTQMVDKMASASSNSNTTVEQLGNAFLTVGGTAKNLKGGTTELATALGILADNGIKGSEGGTALRNIILSLSAPVDKAADKLEALGLKVFDADGNMRSLNDIFKDLNNSMSDLTQEEKTKALNTIFNKVDLKSVNALLANTTTNLASMAAAVEATGVSLEGFGWSAENGEDAVRGMASTISEALTETNGDIQETVNILQTKFKISTEDATTLVEAAASAAGDAGNRFDELSGYIENSAGAAKQMQETQLDNLYGDMKMLGSAVEGVQLQLSNYLTPALRFITQFATNSVIPAISSIVANFGNIVRIIGTFAAATAAFKAYNVLMALMKSSTSLTSATISILGKEYKLAGIAAKTATVASKAFNTALKALKTAAPMIAITVLVEALVALKTAFDDAREKQETYEKATTGLVEAFDDVNESAVETKNALNDIDTSNAKKSFQELRSEIDSNIEAQAELADTISESWGEINANVTLLEGYTAVIDELTKKTDENGEAASLTAEEQAKLQAAVNGINEITGSTIEVLDAENGVLSQSTDEIVKNTQSWIDNARAKAAQEQMVELQKQQLANEEALEDVASRLAEKRNELTEAEKYGLGSAEQLNYEYQQLETEYEKQRGLVDENAEAQERLASKVAKTDDELEESAETLSSWLKLRSDWKDAIGDMGVNTDDFAKRLNELGFTTKDLGKLTTDQLKTMAGTYNGSAAEIIAVCDELGIQVPDKLRQAAEDGAQAIEDTAPRTEEAAEANAEAADRGFGSGDPKGVGKKTGDANADGIESKRGEAQSAAAGNAQAADKGFGSGDSEGVGEDKGEKYAQGVDSAQGQADSAGRRVSNASEGGMKSKNGEAGGWGSHLVENFANGISGAINWVTNAANSVASAVAGILGHTVPKEGLLHEGGEGEKRWGRHLVQNIAEGMLDSKSEIRDAADEIAETVEESLSDMGSDWDSIVETGEGIARGLVVGYDKIDPASQMVASMGALLAMSNTGNVTNNYIDRTQNNTFNNPVKSPDEWARYMNMIDRHGLAGKYV